MKKLIFVLFLVLGLSIWSASKADDISKYKYELRGKELLRGFHAKPADDKYFYLQVWAEKGTFHYYKVNRPKWVREHRVPYPKILDTFKPPTRKQITKYVMGDCSYKRLTHEDKLEVIEDTINFWKRNRTKHKKWKKRVYYTDPTCGAIMMIDETGKESNASMMGLGIGWIQHKLKSGKRFSTQVITLPMCKL